jgi:hypothetical protein
MKLLLFLCTIIGLLPFSVKPITMDEFNKQNSSENQIEKLKHREIRNIIEILKCGIQHFEEQKTFGAKLVIFVFGLPEEVSKTNEAYKGYIKKTKEDLLRCLIPTAYHGNWDDRNINKWDCDRIKEKLFKLEKLMK